MKVTIGLSPYERDPRVDPEVGDVVKRGRISRTVDNFESDPVDNSIPVVYCTERHVDGFSRNVMPFLSQWRKWAAKGEVENGV